MDRERILSKLQREAPLTPDEEAWLDAVLDEQAGDSRLLMKSGSDDEPSLAWRSRLNERLAERPPSSRTNRWVRGLLPVAGLACAAAVWVFFLIASIPEGPSPAAPPPSIEAQLLNAHRDAASAIDIGNVSDLGGSTPQGGAKLVEWSETDLGPL